MKVLPSPGALVDGDLAAEQADQLAADREPETGAAVEARRGAVALRERLEDPLLLLVVDADPGVGDRERDDRRRLDERRRVRGSSRRSREADRRAPRRAR